MDTSEISETGQGYSKFHRAGRIAMGIGVLGVLIVAIGFGMWLYGEVKESQKIAALEKDVKDLKAMAAKPAAALPVAPAPVTQPAAVAVAPVPAPKVVPLLTPAGEWAVRLHTLRGDPKGNYDIADETRETEDAFKVCAKVHHIALTLCVAKTVKQSCKGCNVKFAALAKTASGMTDEEAKEIAGCFNRNMEIVGQTNAAEPAQLIDFDADCQTATP